jgi:hypothetical protein
MISGALPALLTFFIRMFVPESHRWLEGHGRGATKQWSTPDMLTVVVGAVAAVGLVSLWAVDHPLGIANPSLILLVRIVGTAIGLVVAYFAYTYPVRRFLERSMALETDASAQVWTPKRVLGRMILGATLSGMALLGTWASLQNAAPWAGRLEERRLQESNPGMSDAELKQAAARPAMLARAQTQIWSGIGAIIGTILAALAGDWLGRRMSYFLLCVASLASSLLFFQGNDHVGPFFFTTVLIAGGMTASFYGWLPLYLPELFPTRVRAFSQGFAFNFGRIVAAVGALQFGYLMQNVFNGSYPKACTVLSMIYLVGMLVIWWAPETRGRELPE